MLLFLLGCALSRHPTQPAVVPAASASAWDEILARPGILELEAAVSARSWVKAAGLVDLTDPKAEALGLEGEELPVALPVLALRHPERGIFVVDTGVPRDIRESARGLARRELRKIKTERPLGDIVGALGGPVAGVLITHAHADHVLGLPDMPVETPIYMGPGELEVRRPLHALLRRTYNALLRDRPVYTWDFEHAPDIEGIRALDVVGDGSLWALASPGHTPGSTAYLALTTEGPILAVGDTSHTIWGWENGVTPGTFTADHAGNAESLAKLRALAARHPEIRVYVGHELDGAGTGVDHEEE